MHSPATGAERDQCKSIALNTGLHVKHGIIGHGPKSAPKSLTWQRMRWSI